MSGFKDQYGSGSNLKPSGTFSQVFAVVSQIKLLKTDFGNFFFQNSFHFVYLVAGKQFKRKQGTDTNLVNF